MKRMPRHIMVLLCVLGLTVPTWSRGNADLFAGAEPVEVDFVLTAYYSPEPGQCCYVRGGYEADKVLNGEGARGADGTSVFPGMAAAPADIPFGTRILLPGIGTVGVHDRGGAIRVLNSGEYRLDLWAGYGEEGLARALAFGVQRMRGTVYPVGIEQPAVSLALDTLPAAYDRLEPFAVHAGDLLAVQPQLNDRGPSVTLLQEYLQRTGYFDRKPTGFFGPETQQSLRIFAQDYGLTAPTDQLGEELAAYLQAARDREEAANPVSAFIEQGAAPTVIMEAQRTLRFLGYYAGRTDGTYSDELKQAILRFQQDHGLVGTAQDPGAGRVGPLTNQKLTHAWNRALVAVRAARLLDRKKVGELLSERGEVPDRFFEEGYAHEHVRTIQRLLAQESFFPEDRISGYYGPVTTQAVLQYQLAKGIIKNADDPGAGRVGPSTLERLREERIAAAYRRVRAFGWGAV